MKIIKTIALSICLLILSSRPSFAFENTSTTSTANITVSVDQVYSATAVPEINISSKSSIVQKIVDIFGGSKNNAKITVLNPEGKKIVDQEIANNESVVSLDGNNFVPGNYKVSINDIPSLNFSWGVLVINHDQSSYLPHQTAYLQMASLSAAGHTLCQSHLALQITSPTGQVTSPSIATSKTCDFNNVTDSPDYFAYYETTSIGTYQIKLTNLDNNFTITDSFIVEDNLPFKIERLGATRINPFKADYTMKLKVTARQDFQGTIKEQLPSGFTLVNSKNSWDVSLTTGQERTLSYTYHAPQVSPQIFLLGPLTLGNYSEGRVWSLASDATFTMQTGYYIGDGADNRAITGVGFQPELILIKDDTDNGTDGIIWKSSSMTGEVSALLGEAEADLATNAIQSLDSDGFTLGTYADVNAANVRFTWIAFRGSDCTSSGTFCVGSYTGNGADPRTVTTVGFQPNMVTVKRSGASVGVFRTSSMGTNVTQFFDGGNEATGGGYFQTLDSTGFTIGNQAGINTNGDTYWFFAFKTTANAFAVGTYTGDGADNRAITGVGFKPQYLWDKVSNDAGGGKRLGFNLTETDGDYTGAANDNGNATDYIQTLDSDGFTIGTGVNVNASGKTFYWVAFAGATNPIASGTYTMKVGSYTGNGTSQSFSSFGFAPDLVMVKDGSGTNYAVFRTKLMKGDSTAYFSNGAANFTGGITSLDSDGFSVGAGVTVNTNSTVYHYQAFGNAFNPEDNTGAADFAIGAHTGNLTDNRSIVRVPFQPNLVALKAANTNGGVLRTSAQSGDLSLPLEGAEAANYIQALQSDGFQVGSVGAVNSDATIDNWFAFKASNTMVVNNYTGTGSAQNITAVGFSPNLVWVKGTGSYSGVFRPSSLAGNSTLFMNNVAAASDLITAMLSNGFSIGGNQVQTNTSGGTYRYAAWKIPTPTAFSFQRKTWYDGTRVWKSYSIGTQIVFYYSTDWGTNWTQNTSATITVSTNDFSIEADSSNVFIVLTNGYDITAQTATSYPGTAFAWGAATTLYDGSSTTDEFDYPSITKDTNNKIWVSSIHHSSADYIFKVDQSTNANDITAWQTITSLDTSTNSNKYGVVVGRTSGAVYAAWIDSAAIEGKNYNGTSWDASPTSIATGVTGFSNNMSAVSDSSGNVHLLYIDSSDHTVYQEFTSSWQTAVTLDSNAGNDYLSISLDTASGDLYAFWIRSNTIYYKKGVSPYASENWDGAATSFYSTGDNSWVTSNYSGNGMIFAEWTNGTSSPYSINWNYIIVPENLWLLFCLGIIIPIWLNRRRGRIRYYAAEKNI